MANPSHGGKRTGAGRPTDASREAKKNEAQARLGKLQARALADADRIYDALLDLAVGCFYEGCVNCEQPLPCKCRKRGEGVRIYKRLPCQRAGSDLWQHIKGRAAVAPQVQQDSTIILRLGGVPRPKAKGTDEEDASGDAAVPGDVEAELRDAED